MKNSYSYSHHSSLLSILFCKPVFLLSFYLTDLSWCEPASLSVGKLASSSSEFVLAKGFASSYFKITGCMLRTRFAFTRAFSLNTRHLLVWVHHERCAQICMHFERIMHSICADFARQRLLFLRSYTMPCAYQSKRRACVRVETSCMSVKDLTVICSWT